MPGTPLSRVLLISTTIAHSLQACNYSHGTQVYRLRSSKRLARLDLLPITSPSAAAWFARGTALTERNPHGRRDGTCNCPQHSQHRQSPHLG
jgi:hypothetical protein